MEGTNVRVRAKAMAAAGSDARMNGCELPVVINSGSGNQGMTCSLPVIEYAKELKVSEKELHDIESNIDMLNIVSLNYVIFEDTNETVQDVISDREEEAPENIIEEEEKLEILSKAISNLNEREKLILSLYYYEDLNLKEIGKVLGVSESRVSQLHRKSIRNLRNKIKELKYSI